MTPTPYAQVATLDFDPTADFHDYAIEWTLAEARFLIDGEVKRTWSDRSIASSCPRTSC